jgi:hypothetical protein
MLFSYSKIAGFSAVLLFFGAGCVPTPEPPVATYDVTQTTCEGIAEARQKVLQNYQQAVETAGKTYAEARQAFSDDLNTCLRDIWKGGPCDAEWKASQQAAERAWNNISNDDAYYGWKKAKADWDACYGNYAEKQKEWSEKNLAKERTCQEEFQAKVDAAQKAHADAVAAAKSKRESDLAYLDELEKKCKEKPKTGGGSGTTPVTPPPVQPPTTLPKSACEAPGIPGSQGTPRTGPSPDFGPKDIVVNLMTQVAEEVTKTPLPISAIDNQIFAGIVCAKIRSRIAEMTIEESDADLSGDRTTVIRLRKKIAQYGRALDVWCGIAAGKKPLAEVKADVAAINAMPSGSCKKDADCTAAPLCCSANSIATSHCDVETGACVSRVQSCGGSYVCMGPDAAQPKFDHCGPAHEGNWMYGAPKPANWSFPKPGVPRVSTPSMQIEVRMNL